MHTKPFFPFYQGNKESTAPTEALFLPLAHQQPPPQTLFQNSREQSNTFPKTLKSGFVPAFAIHCTMNLQPQSSFAEVINTFTESSISSLDLVDRETILPSPVLVFCVWVLLIGWLMLMGFFFLSLFFQPLKLCVKLHLAKENRRGQEGGMAMPELGHMYHSTPQHPKDVTERWLPPEQPWYATADAKSQ